MQRVARTGHLSSLHVRVALDHAHTIDIVSPHAIALADFGPEHEHVGSGDPFVANITAQARVTPPLSDVAGPTPGASARAVIGPVDAPPRAEEPGSMSYRAWLTAAIAGALIGLIALGGGTTLRQILRRRHRRALG